VSWGKEDAAPATLSFLRLSADLNYRCDRYDRYDGGSVYGTSQRHTFGYFTDKGVTGMTKAMNFDGHCKYEG